MSKRYRFHEVAAGVVMDAVRLVRNKGADAAIDATQEVIRKEAQAAQIRALEAAIVVCPIMNMGIKDKLIAFKQRVEKGELL